MGERKAPTPPPTDQGKPEPPPAPPVRRLLGHLQDVHVVHSPDGALVGLSATIEPARELVHRMMLRNAVSLLRRIVDGRVLSHGGPDGLELDARRILDWYAEVAKDIATVPSGDTAMTRAELIAALAECYRLTGADPDGNEDWRLAEDAVKEVRRLRHEVERLEAAPNGQAYLVDLKRQAADRG